VGHTALHLAVYLIASQTQCEVNSNYAPVSNGFGPLNVAIGIGGQNGISSSIQGHILVRDMQLRELLISCKSPQISLKPVVFSMTGLAKADGN
jgi:hypothetical protein